MPHAERNKRTRTKNADIEIHRRTDTHTQAHSHTRTRTHTHTHIQAHARALARVPPRATPERMYFFRCASSLGNVAEHTQRADHTGDAVTLSLQAEQRCYPYGPAQRRNQRMARKLKSVVNKGMAILRCERHEFSFVTSGRLPPVGTLCNVRAFFQTRCGQAQVVRALF